MADAHGYDPRFFGLGLPLPVPADGRPLRELDYSHFSVRLDPQRRLACVTGVNIDGATLRDLPRTGEWRFDDRVPASEQTGPEVYADNDLDRGHLVRRRDPGWGSAKDARVATEATFVYPNAAPQASVFNQSDQLWLGLEDHVLQYADATDLRLSVFTAPVLDDGDPPYRGIRIPLRFFKVVAWSSADVGAPVLAAAGFVLDQTSLIDTSEGVLTVAPLGAYRTFQTPVADIAELAGVDFGDLVAADVMPSARRGSDAWRLVETVGDIDLG